LIFVPGASLSAGLALILLVASLLRGLTCPAAPAGVFAPSTTINRFLKNNFGILTEPKKMVLILPFINNSILL
jgi:hypothetical protein